MIRVITYDVDAAQRVRIRGALERCARDCHVKNVNVTPASSLKLLRSTVLNSRIGLYDLVVCNVQEEGALDVLRDLSAYSPGISLVVTSAQREDAVHAFELGGGFYLLSDGYNAFCAVVGDALSKIASHSQNTFALRSTNGMENISLDDVLFVESTKKGPIVHLAGREDVMTHGTLQALFERLSQADTERFMKVGGSFIVNLDNIRSAGESSVIFTDGETVIAPVRTRKLLKEALANYQSASREITADAS